MGQTIIQSFQEYWALTLYKLPTLLIAVVVFIVFLIIAKTAGILLKRILEKIKIEKRDRFVVSYVIKIIIFAAGIIVALAILGVNLTALITALGLTGLALGFALQDIIRNFIGGILILIQKPFNIGDQIKMGEVSGKVKRINTRSTIIRTFDGNDVVVPNQNILKENIVCLTTFPKRRSDFVLRINENNSIKRAAQFGLEALKDTPGVLEKPEPQIAIDKIECGYIILRFYFWWTAWRPKGELLPVKSLAMKSVKEKFDREGVSLSKNLTR